MTDSTTKHLKSLITQRTKEKEYRDRNEVTFKVSKIIKFKPTLLIASLLILTFFIAGCGSAEAIRGYRYETTKINLEKAVRKVLTSNPNIYVDTTQSQVRVRRNPDNPNDTSTIFINLADFHSPDSTQVAKYFKRYIKFRIKLGQADNYYEFHFLGDEQYWKSSSSSEILLSEASDNHGNSLSQGHNENGQFNSKIAKTLTQLFESELLHYVDEELNLKHTVR